MSLEEIRSVSQLQLLCISNEVSDDKLFIGFLTRQRLRQLEDDGFELTKIKTFYCALQKFYKACFHYAVKNLPLDDVVFRNSRFANFASTKDVSVEDVKYFIDRYSTILKFGAPEYDSLHDEFISYQLLSDDDIPPQVTKEATVLQISMMVRKKDISAWIS